MVRQRLSSGTTPLRSSFGDAPTIATSGNKKPAAKSDAEHVPAGKAHKTSATRKRKIDWAELDDSDFGGFQIRAATIKPSKKQSAKRQKTDSSVDRVARDDAPTDADIIQPNPFNEVDLSATHHVIEPAAEWKSMTGFKNFTLFDELFQVGQNIWVKTANVQGDEEASTLEVARILEIRASNAAHVYLRVYWMYMPEDLPDGRQAYHGECELIASNHMDVIEATNVEDKADVVYWNDDLSEMPEEGQYFFRQTYDVVKGKGKQLSTLRAYCIDRAPSNPDEPHIQCPSCSEWLHGYCLEERAVQDVYEENKIDKAQKRGPGRPKKGRKSPSKPAFEAEISIIKSGKKRLTVTDKRPDQNSRRWHVHVKCLSCHAIIEKAVEREEAEEEDKEEVDIPEENQKDEEDNIVVDSKTRTLRASDTKDEDRIEDEKPQDETTTTPSTETTQLDPTPIQSSSKTKQPKRPDTRTSDVAKSPTDTTSRSNGEKTTKPPVAAWSTKIVASSTTAKTS